MFLGIVVVGLALGWLLRPDGSGVAFRGEAAPDFTVELLSGGSFTLSDHLASASGPTVINLWASWCIPCRTEMPAISRFAESNPEVSVLGVAVQDEIGAARAFAEEVAPSYPLAFDDSSFGDLYPVLGLPATYILDSSGIVRQIHNGIVDEETLAELVEGVG